MSRPGLPLDPVGTRDRASRSLVAWVSLLLIAGVLAYGLLMVRDFNVSLGPEIDRRARLIGETVRDDLDRALDVGIPLGELAGMDAYLDSFLDEFAELDYLAIRGQSGEVLYGGGKDPPPPRIALPGAGEGRAPGREEIGGSYVYSLAIGEGATAMGTIEIGVDRFFARSKLQEVALDVGVILIVALVAAFEVTLAINQRMMGRRRRGHAPPDERARAGSVGDIRLALFLFAIGEELNKSFLPQFIQAAENPFGWLDPKVAISLPIVAYLLTLAIASPLAGRLAVRVGPRGLFLIGLIPAALSHLGMMFANDVVTIMGLRALTGVGYGLATVACQEYLLDRMPPDARARTIGVFVAVVIGGTFAGTALGGIFADRMGYQAVFAISFALVVVSALFALGMRSGRPASWKPSESFSLRSFGLVSRRPSLLLLLAGVTIPMNVLSASFLWYLVPLLMADIGASASAIGRTLMLYYLVILIGGTLIGNVADRLSNRWLLVGLGSALSGAALFLPALMPLNLTILLAVLVLGVGHAAVRGPQIALALEIADSELSPDGRGAMLAAMRSLERLGSLVGLLAVGLLAARFGFVVALTAIGIVTTGAALVFLLAGPLLRRARASRGEVAAR